MPVRHKPLAVALAVVMAAMVAAGFAYFPSDDGRTARATADTRRSVLILAGASGQGELRVDPGGP
ncbi:hypothetical protein BIV25_15415 [Streptomyces sp. MUSC 14]|uniref:hypothetical protein n=1 Tax=Streptomyces sp. MUSC 14 TaxID=1354889 RepID=UPI0008F59DA6|nr:hypothetical protein [Streptomyces sp. MUSC 14]OIJ97609.1 hypothetical protein BIV25_15415 [Streptomyces sp. MUSC 14]